jgi:hypothetical protein
VPADWETAWSGGQGITGLFRAELLAESAVTVLGGYDGGRMVAGAVANRSASVVGISNLFTTGDDVDRTWAGCLAAATRLWPGLPVVGYEDGDDLAAAVRQGWLPIGPVRIWRRTA